MAPTESAVTGATKVLPDPSRARDRRSGAVVIGAGWVALLVIAVGVAVAFVPVRNGDVQACGTPGAFLIEGRSDVYPDAGGRVRDGDGVDVQLSPSAVQAAVDRPCSQRVADRMVPAGVLLAGGTLTGLACVLAGAIGAWRRRPTDPGGDVEPNPEAGGDPSGEQT